MLTLIARTMLPEAYIKGGNVVGFATPPAFWSRCSYSKSADPAPCLRFRNDSGAPLMHFQPVRQSESFNDSRRVVTPPSCPALQRGTFLPSCVAAGAPG
jgi:hypothetical protein